MSNSGGRAVILTLRKGKHYVFGCFLFALMPNLPAAPAFAVTPTATELPTNGTVTSGQATITSSNAVMNVTQSTNKAIINWGTFNIGSQAQVNFSQPNASSKTLNRVTGGNSSQIYGKMTANGEVYLINPNGVVIGEGAQITANGVVVSTLDITDQDFGTGTSKFERNAAPGAVVNEGSIITPSEGYVALLGVNVSNKGSINTGKAILAAGDKIEIPVTESGLISIEAETEAAAVTHEGTIKASNVQLLSSGSVTAKGTSLIDASSATAKGGTVSLIGKTVKIKDQAKIKASGKTGGGISIGEKTKTTTVEIGEGTRLEANATGSGDGGNILLWSNAATTIAGSIFAQGGAEGGNGGFVETSSTGNVKIRDSAEINTTAFLGKTGTWLLDPVTYTIAASGGDETGASVATSLASSNREIAADTIIYVNDGISWSANTLTLTAGTDININAIMTATGTAGLVMTTTSGNVNIGLTSSGFTGKINLASGTSLNINGHAYTIINSLGSSTSTSGIDLQGMRGNLAGYYALGSDIDASTTSSWNSGAGFIPIGTSFAGAFNGLGHTITGLYINRSGTTYASMFGQISSGALVSNVGLISATVHAKDCGGTLAGRNSGAVRNVYATGNVTGASTYTGGLIGLNQSTINNSFTNVSVSGTADVGGMVGYNSGGKIYDSFSLGNVSGSGSYIGGLVGYNYYAGATVTRSYASGDVTGSSTYVGGLVGYSTSSGANAMRDSYATGKVSGTDYVGGLIGRNNYGETITTSYATGQVICSGTCSYVGGLAASSNGTITNSFWDKTTTGQNTSSGGGTGYVTSGMTSFATFSSKFSIAKSGTSTASGSVTWVIYDGLTYPLLKNLLTPLTITANNASTTYNGTAYTGGPAGVSYSQSSVDDSKLFGTLAYSGTYSTAETAGSYTIIPSGQYSNQKGYDITFTSGALTVSPASLTITANSASKTYGSTITLGTTAYAITSGSLFGSDSVEGVSLASAGTAATATATSYAITASAASGTGLTNYSITYAPGTLTVNPAPLSITVTNRAKTYGEVLELGSTAFELSGTLYNGDTVTGATLQSAGAATSATVGSYEITASSATGTGVGNYNITYESGALNITTAPLAITAQSQSKMSGTTLNLGTEAFDTYGLHNNDSVAAVTLTSLGSGPSVGPGAYNIVASDAIGTGLANYAITYVDGVLTVTPAPTGEKIVGAFVSKMSADISQTNAAVPGTLCDSQGITIAGENEPQPGNITPNTTSKILATCGLCEGVGSN